MYLIQFYERISNCGVQESYENMKFSYCVTILIGGKSGRTLVLLKKALVGRPSISYFNHCILYGIWWDWDKFGLDPLSVCQDLQVSYENKGYSDSSSKTEWEHFILKQLLVRKMLPKLWELTLKMPSSNRNVAN